MNKIKFFVAVLFLAGLFVGRGVYADGFVINLYYDANTQKLNLSGNKDNRVYRDKNADTSIVEFSKDTATGSYILKLYDANGVNFSNSEFDKQDGEFQLVIPYFSIAAKMEIVEKSNNKILSTEDLTHFMTCNVNGVCEPNIGETEGGCMGDCLGNTNKSSGVVSLESEASNLGEPESVSTEEETFLSKIFSFLTNLFR